MAHSKADIGIETIHKAYEEFDYFFDSDFGGFGSAPKFPTPHNLLFLLRYYDVYDKKDSLDMVEKTLESIYSWQLHILKLIMLQRGHCIRRLPVIYLLIFSGIRLRLADFIEDKLTREDGRLLARYKDGQSAYLEYLDDYAFLVWGLVELYEAAFETSFFLMALLFRKVPAREIDL